MLKKILIENFQSHKKSEFDFVPGVNVIIGASDTGKSAIFNAINWVVTNRPLGESFRSEWGGDTKVIIYTDSDEQVSRGRTQSTNEYVINDVPLTAFKSDVPQAVLDILQLDAYSIQSQMDSPFLLSLSPGEAAKLLNKAASIDEIDSSIASLRKALHQINSDIEYNSKELERYNKEIGQYNNLPELEDQVIAVEKLFKEKGDLMRRASTLNSLHREVKGLHLRLHSLDYLSETIDPLLISAEGLEIQRKEVKEKQTNLMGICRNIKRLMGNVAEVDDRVKALEKEYSDKMPDTCPLCGGITK
jgi:exonuclease SbcC